MPAIGELRWAWSKTELIYVDSASSDGSPQVAANFDAQVVVLHGGVQTAARARNAGWQQASAPYILFLDGDTILNPHFIPTAREVLESDPSIAAVWGHRRELYPERSIYNRVLDLDWIYPAGDTDFCGGDVLMRRTTLSQVAGYDPGLIAGEEPELCRRLRARGYRIVHIDAPMTRHDLNMTRFSQYWRRAMRAGYAYSEVSNRFRGSGDPMWLRESRRNVCSGSFWIAWLVVSVLLLAFEERLDPTLVRAADCLRQLVQPGRHARERLAKGVCSCSTASTPSCSKYPYWLDS